MPVSRPDPDVTSSNGDLTYNMKIRQFAYSEKPGSGESEIVISPNHNLAGIGAR